ncbi:hypothetical protein E2C01_047817 [Portunus trituberculatus]|uniref:Uncharacterized protein n=1 Tax=Portunus trituberculatus TaxID=210409 RepID=A0A5B7GBJ4_PORTR|nr:hypothetical protein [Portunus trituberculatus]
MFNRSVWRITVADASFTVSCQHHTARITPPSQHALVSTPTGGTLGRCPRKSSYSEKLLKNIKISVGIVAHPAATVVVLGPPQLHDELDPAAIHPSPTGPATRTKHSIAQHAAQPLRGAGRQSKPPPKCGCALPRWQIIHLGKYTRAMYTPHVCLYTSTPPCLPATLPPPSWSIPLVGG